MKSKSKKITIFLSVFIITNALTFASEHDISFGLGASLGYGGSYKNYHNEEDKLDPQSLGFCVENYNIMFFENFGFMERVVLGMPVGMPQDGVDFILMAGPAYKINLGHPVHLQLAAGLQIDALDTKDNWETINLFQMGLAAEARFKFTAHKKCSPVIGLSMAFNPIVSGEYDSTIYSDHEASKISGPIFAVGIYGQFCINIK